MNLLSSAGCRASDYAVMETMDEVFMHCNQQYQRDVTYQHQQTSPPLYRAVTALYRVTESIERYPLIQYLEELYRSITSS